MSAIVVETRTEQLRRILSTPATGWEFSIWADQPDDEPRVRDIDAATRLGYQQPRNVRQVIKRIWPANKLPSCRTAVVRQPVGPGGKGTREVKVTEFWLTEAELLKLIARSETPVAEAILDEMIAVYMAVRRHLVTAVPVRAHERKLPTPSLPTPPAPALTAAQKFIVPYGPVANPKPPPAAPVSKPFPVALEKRLDRPDRTLAGRPHWDVTVMLSDESLAIVRSMAKGRPLEEVVDLAVAAWLLNAVALGLAPMPRLTS